MTELNSLAPRTASPKRTPSENTIYRDTPFADQPASRTVSVRRPTRLRLAAPFLVQDEHASDGILLGLAALTLPAVVYSFAQLWSLLGGGSLQHAIRAFLP